MARGSGGAGEQAVPTPRQDSPVSVAPEMTFSAGLEGAG
jgi:hypothetical protein